MIKISKDRKTQLLIILSVVVCVLILFSFFAFLYKRFSPDFKLEIRSISTFTDTQKIIVCHEFGLESKEELLFIDLCYIRNYTFWGWGNKIATLNLSVENLSELIDNQAIFDLKTIGDSWQKFWWAAPSGDKIFALYNGEQKALELKMMNHNISQPFCDMLKDDNVKVEYKK